MSSRKHEMTKEHAVERAMRVLLGETQRLPEAKRGPTPEASPDRSSKFGQRPAKPKPR